MKKTDKCKELVVCHLAIHAGTVPCFGELLSFHSQESYPLKIRSVDHLGRRGGTRTRTMSPSLDFKSRVSTDSTTLPKEEDKREEKLERKEETFFFSLYLFYIYYIIFFLKNQKTLGSSQ